ncbi:LysR family transcriptional regulator, partial [Klebsiella michiganensis]
FSQRHPALRVRHVSSSHHADLISERFDVAIRLGTLADSRYRAALISRFAIVPVAAPSWLAQHPVKTLEELAHAAWIIHERLTAPLRWPLTGPDEESIAFEIKQAPRLSADSASALMAFALAGSSAMPLPASAKAISALVKVMPAFSFPRQGVYAVYPDAQHVPVRVRAFIDFLRERLG